MDESVRRANFKRSSIRVHEIIIAITIKIPKKTNSTPLKLWWKSCHEAEETKWHRNSQGYSIPEAGKDGILWSSLKDDHGGIIICVINSWYGSRDIFPIQQNLQVFVLESNLYMREVECSNNSSGVGCS